jgi:hypothetical protein
MSDEGRGTGSAGPQTGWDRLGGTADGAGRVGGTAGEVEDSLLAPVSRS